jgi:hypothetical protein
VHRHYRFKIKASIAAGAYGLQSGAWIDFIVGCGELSSSDFTDTIGTVN